MLAQSPGQMALIGRLHPLRTHRVDGVRIYRFALLGAAGLVGAAGHLGGLLVWGVNYFRP